ncbi:MAG TPA: zinc ribbon domain-containing protein [Micromonosporaceae bacterium]|nr:zinc ribbon domain-containing protein [Micromonosporaceae bacterium]
MPRYEYRCRDCGAMFEVHRPMREAGVSSPCPAGHGDTVKLLSTVALTGRGAGGGSRDYGPSLSGAGGSSGGSAGGGCCGGGCGC